MPALDRLDPLIQDVRYGLRTMRTSAGFTAVAVIALALGIGASTAIFSVVDAVLLRPLPYRDPGGLLTILHRGDDPVSPANFLDWRVENTSFERMGAAELWTPDLTGGDAPETVSALRIGFDVFPMLGIAPLHGRVFLPEEEHGGKDHEVVLGHGLWQRRFGGDPGVLGHAITLNGEAYTIVGVMPPGFRFAPFWATRAELWSPLSLDDRAANREGSSLRIFARLRRGATLESARAEMAAITAGLEKEFPGTNREVAVVSLTEKVVGGIRPALLVLMGAVGFVLLTACANVAHMLLSRAAVRHKQVAVRMALGASRARMIRQSLTESLLLALVGGGAGLLVASAGIRALLALSPAGLPRADTVSLDGRVLAFALVVSLGSAVAFGLAPALRSSSHELTGALKESERGSTEGIGRNRLRSLLVASEFALALMLLVGAGLMIRSFLALQAIDPGFDPRNVLTAVVSVSASDQGQPPRRGLFFEELVRRVGALPGVASASAINHLPLAGDIWGWPFNVEGRPLPPPGETPSAVYRVVFPGYFRAMGMRLLRGRDVAESDDLNAAPVVVVNERLAARHWPGEDAIGKRITFDNLDKDPKWVTVVGVVKDARQESWAAPPKPELYLPYLQNRYYLEKRSSHLAYVTLVARTAGDPAALAPALRNAVHSFDANAPVSQVQTMEAVVSQSNGEPRFMLLLLGVFAGVALVLAAVGIYGVMSYTVSRRAHEIGIRMAIGAAPADVLRLVVGQGMAVALAGAGAGIAGALALTRLMSGLLYGVSPTDPATFVSLPLVLGAVALAACAVPALRAARVDPAAALREG